MSISKAFADAVRQSVEEGIFESKYEKIIFDAYQRYYKALKDGGQDTSRVPEIFDFFLTLIKKQCSDPVVFESFHQRCSDPYDYYNFGLDFVRPLVDIENSCVYGFENIEKMLKQLSQGENVILLANHQTEADPQILDTLLEKKYPDFVKNIIFVAGARVLLDTLAAPFSIGLNLLCIYSKKHIDHPPEEKDEKRHHNKRTMMVMGKILHEGGKCIYVAPSGGRDRPNSKGDVEVGEFDPRSIDIFELIAKKSKKITHFYPLSLVTYDIAPPPKVVEKDLGEARILAYNSAKISFGEELEMQRPDETSEERASRIHEIIKNEHDTIK